MRLRFEDRLKHAFLPGWLYYSYKVAKEARAAELLNLVRQRVSRPVQFPVIDAMDPVHKRMAAQHGPRPGPN